MNAELILCKMIDAPTPAADDKDRRKFSKNFAAKLAESIRIDGLLQPIVVRPNPASPGRYIRVAGAHRFHAVANVLKQEVIACHVIVDMDEIDAIMATDAENLFRNPLTKPQLLLALQRWHQHYAAKYPEKVHRARAGGLARGKQLASDAKQRRQQYDPAPVPAPEPAPGDSGAANANLAYAAQDAPVPDPEPAPTPEPSSFPELVSAATGEGLRTAQRSVQLARAFTPDQIEIFDAMGVKQVQMEAIVKVRDVARRNEIVNLIASGMEPEEAIAQITNPANPKTDDADLNDEDWAAKVCKDLYGRIANKQRFVSDVSMYRKTAAAVGQAKGKIFKKLTAAKGPRGSYSRLLYRLLNLSHPKRWFMCGPCKGTGLEGGRPGGNPCPSCYGDSYKTTSEG